MRKIFICFDRGAFKIPKRFPLPNYFSKTVLIRTEQAEGSRLIEPRAYTCEMPLPVFGGEKVMWNNGEIYTHYVD